MEAKRKILVADAGEEYRKTLIELLSTESDLQIVGQTGDGEELLHLIREQKPDLVVMDVILARMDGVEVLETLEQQPRAPRCW